MSTDPALDAKRAAAEWAADLVEAHMVVGLGTGSTAIIAVRRIAERLADGTLADIVAIPTSSVTAAEAAGLGIALTSLEDHPVIDLTIDGADEVDPELSLIKGGGGALLREKIVAQATRREVIVVDPGKCSERLGTRFHLPVEVVDFGWLPEARHLESLGGTATLRKAPDGSVMRTDQGNLILDWAHGPIEDPEALEAKLLARAGVVEVGLFCGLTTDLVIGAPDGVEHRTS
ncbi:MAG: ribose-5-phosphate isomerase RpiA [Acidimicrobiales bacterium]